MKRTLLFAATALLASLPAGTDAQLAPALNAQEYLNYLRPATATVSTGLAPRVYVGPYEGRFEASALRSVRSGSFSLYCVDYLHYASSSDGLVNVWGVDNSLGDVATTRFDNAGTYLRAAYLSSLFEAYEGDSDQRYQWSALHSAIWRTTSGANTATNASVEARADYFFNLAVPDDFTGEGWYVLSSVELAARGYENAAYDGTGQEFLVRAEHSVPEPGTYLLLATGLLIMAGANRRRFAEVV